MTTPSPRPSQRQTWKGVAIVAVAILGVCAYYALRKYVTHDAFLFVLVLGLAVAPWLEERRTRRLGLNSPYASLRSRIALVTSRCSPEGQVRLDGSIWNALSVDSASLEVGERVYVHDGDGLQLHVSRGRPI
jgi:membrane protein implicated in regulation of membrane protease activity